VALAPGDGFEMLWELTAILARSLRHFVRDPQRTSPVGGGFVSSTAHAERAANRECACLSHPSCASRVLKTGVPLEVGASAPPIFT